MVSKYEIYFSDETIKKNINRLTNQLWKLIPMKEHNEDWKKQIDTVMIELLGLQEVFENRLNLLQLLCKLEGLKKVEEIQFNIYRKTVFETIGLLQGLMNVE